MTDERIVVGMTIAAVMAAFSLPAYAVKTQTVKIDGSDVLIQSPDSGCPTGCAMVLYLHPMGEAGKVPDQIRSYFGSAFQSAVPNAIVVAPQLSGNNGVDRNWGGVGQNGTEGQKLALDAVSAVKKAYPIKETVAVGGSMGGIGVQGLMEQYGPNSATPVIDKGLAFDGSVWNAGQARQALCGLPLTIVHGADDNTVSPSSDRTLADSLKGCPGFSATFVQGMGHGTYSAAGGLSNPKWIKDLLGESVTASTALLATPAPQTTQMRQSTDFVPRVRTQTVDLPVSQDLPTLSGPCTSSGTSGEYGILPTENNGIGKIFGPDKRVFRPMGVNVMFNSGNSMPSAAKLKSMYPGINFVRMPVYHYEDPQTLAPYVKDLTSAGIVVEIENHDNQAGGSGGSVGPIFTGDLLDKQSKWYASVASAFKDNPRVWFGTRNEQAQYDLNLLGQEQLATYNAIRNAGNRAPILLQVTGGSDNVNEGMPQSVYSGMTNVAWDVHHYGWTSKGSKNQSEVNAVLDRMVRLAQRITSSGGVKPPIIVGEYGNSTTGVEIDVNGQETIKSVHASTTIAGSAAWMHDVGHPGDGLINPDGSLTADFGIPVRNAISANAQSSGGSTAAACGEPLVAQAPSTVTPPIQTSQTYTPVVGPAPFSPSLENRTSPPATPPAQQPASPALQPMPAGTSATIAETQRLQAAAASMQSDLDRWMPQLQSLANGAMIPDPDSVRGDAALEPAANKIGQSLLPSR